MPLSEEGYYTIEDILNLPDGQRAELIDGQMYMVAPPNRKHQEILHFLDRTIGNYMEDNNGDCKIYPAPFSVYLFNDDKIYLEPDITVICDRDKLDDAGCKGAPDWIIEIVSPSSKRMDYYNKLFKYRTAGVREYWIVDPLNNIITVHFFEDEKSPHQYSFSDTVKVNIYDDLEIDFSKLRF